MLHSFKLKHLAVLLSLGLFTESCRRDSIDPVEIDATRARTRNTLTPLFTLDFHGVGAIGLSAEQEAAIVAFMRTLDDGYTGVTQ